MFIRMQDSTIHYTATMGIVKRVTFIAAELATVVLRILRFGAIDTCFYIVDGSVECFHQPLFIATDLANERAQLFAQFERLFLAPHLRKYANLHHFDFFCAGFPFMLTHNRD